MDRRAINRVPSRLRVQFETGDLKGIAFTADISADGCQLQSSAPLRPGTRLRGRILLEGQPGIAFDGEVRWAHHVDWALGQQFPNCLGVSFAAPPSEAYYQHLRSRSEAVQ